MATKEEIKWAFDNALRLPIIWRDEPQIICEDQMFVCSDIPPAELGADKRSGNVFLYEPEGSDEASIRIKYGVDRGERWYIPSHAEYHALKGTVDVDTVLPWHHRYLGAPNHERSWAADYRLDRLDGQRVFEHLRHKVQSAHAIFARTYSTYKPCTQRYARDVYERTAGQIDAALEWGLIDRQHHSALIERLHVVWNRNQRALVKFKLSPQFKRRKSKGGAA